MYREQRGIDMRRAWNEEDGRPNGKLHGGRSVRDIMDDVECDRLVVADTANEQTQIRVLVVAHSE